jgi:hypothetical protein
VLQESGSDVVVEVGNVLVEGHPVTPEVVEVASYPPVGGGAYRIEVLPFTKMGTLNPILEGMEFPIAGGVFLLTTVAGRIREVATGSPVVLDLLKNGVSIFSNPVDRPTIQPGLHNLVATIPPGIMFADGDYLELNIVSVGSTTPGVDLVVSVRLTRIG